MKIEGAPCVAIDWREVEVAVHPGAQGSATSRTREAGDVRVRLVEYSPGYLADHWCSKGHVVFVLEGRLVTELEDGRTTVLCPGQSCVLADGGIAHRARTEDGAKLFIVD
jgi:quercetin dioxygenase-like cupin family protein